MNCFNAQERVSISSHGRVAPVEPNPLQIRTVNSGRNFKNSFMKVLERDPEQGETVGGHRLGRREGPGCFPLLLHFGGKKQLSPLRAEPGGFPSGCV